MRKVLLPLLRREKKGNRGERVKNLKKGAVSTEGRTTRRKVSQARRSRWSSEKANLYPQVGEHSFQQDSGGRTGHQKAASKEKTRASKGKFADRESGISQGGKKRRVREKKKRGSAR